MGEDKHHLMEDDQYRHMRRVAFLAVVVSTVAVMASVITLPLVYNYIQALQSHMASELDFCKTRTRDMWVEIFQIQSSKQAPRERREWLFGQWVNAVGGAGGAPGGGGGGGGQGPQYGGGGYGPVALPAVQIIPKCKFSIL